MQGRYTVTCTVVESRAVHYAGCMQAHLLGLVALILCYARLWDAHAPPVLPVTLSRPLILIAGALSYSIGICFSHMIPVPVPAINKRQRQDIIVWLDLATERPHEPGMQLPVEARSRQGSAVGHRRGDSNQPLALAVPVLCFVLSIPLFLPLPPLHICRAKEMPETTVLHAPTPMKNCRCSILFFKSNSRMPFRT